MDNPPSFPAALPPWLDRQAYPFAPRGFASSGGRLSYLDEGPRGAPAVLLVHGTPSWSFEWRQVVTALRVAHRVIAPDHLGFGLSDKPDDRPADGRAAPALGPADHAARLRELVEALDLRDVTLVVHDFGGPIGLPLALDGAGRVARVVVANTWMWPNAGDPAVRRIDRVVRSRLGRFLYRWLNLSPRVLLPAAFGDRKLLTKAAHRQYLAPFARRSERAAPYALARALLGADGHYAALWSRREALGRLPLTIAWGERDPALGERHLQRWLEAFPAARHERLPGCGHFVAEERPAELARLIAEAAARPALRSAG